MPIRPVVPRNIDPNKGSEFGGVGGRRQPSPHDPADHPSEILGMVYETDPDNVEQTVELPPPTSQVRR